MEPKCPKWLPRRGLQESAPRVPPGNVRYKRSAMICPLRRVQGARSVRPESSAPDSAATKCPLQKVRPEMSATICPLRNVRNEGSTKCPLRKLRHEMAAKKGPARNVRHEMSATKCPLVCLAAYVGVRACAIGPLHLHVEVLAQLESLPRQGATAEVFELEPFQPRCGGSHGVSRWWGGLRRTRQPSKERILRAKR